MPFDDDLADSNFTPEERRRLRQIMRADDRARWFWATVRIWVTTGCAVAVAVAAIYKGWWAK